MQNLNIINKDLKPENLLVDSNGNVYISDLGFACDIYDNEAKNGAGTPTH